MSESKALAIRQVTPDLWSMMQTIAESAHKSRVLSVGSIPEGAMKILTGHELGLPPMASLRMVYVVKGRPSIQPKAAWALTIGHPEFAGIIEERLLSGTGQFLGYAITLKRKNGVEARRSFTLEDAARAQLLTKDNWKAYPENCCYWRAMAFVQDAVFPDVTMGLYRSDELGADIAPDGSVIEAQWSTTPRSTLTEVAAANAASSPNLPSPTQCTDAPGEVISHNEPATSHNEDADAAQAVQGPPTISLTDLVEKYGPEAVMKAAGGRIPATNLEVAEAAIWLETGNG